MSTFDKVVEVLTEAKDYPAGTITMESTWDQLELDSLDTVELVMSLEDALGVSLEMNDQLQTVGDIVRAIDGE